MARFNVKKKFPEETRDLGHVKMELVRGAWSNATGSVLWAVKVTATGDEARMVVLEDNGSINLEKINRLPSMDDLCVIHELFHRAKQLERTQGG